MREGTDPRLGLHSQISHSLAVSDLIGRPSSPGLSPLANVTFETTFFRGAFSWQGSFTRALPVDSGEPRRQGANAFSPRRLLQKTPRRQGLHFVPRTRDRQPCLFRRGPRNGRSVWPIPGRGGLPLLPGPRTICLGETRAPLVQMAGCRTSRCHFAFQFFFPSGFCCTIRPI